MLRGHKAVAKNLLLAFSRAKIPPRKAHTIGAVASVALAMSSVAADSASEPRPSAGVLEVNSLNQAPSGGLVFRHRNSRVAEDTEGPGNSIGTDMPGAGESFSEMEGNAVDVIRSTRILASGSLAHGNRHTFHVTRFKLDLLCSCFIPSNITMPRGPRPPFLLRYLLTVAGADAVGDAIGGGGGGGGATSEVHQVTVVAIGSTPAEGGMQQGGLGAEGEPSINGEWQRPELIKRSSSVMSGCGTSRALEAGLAVSREVSSCGHPLLSHTVPVTAR